MISMLFGCICVWATYPFELAFISKIQVHLTWYQNRDKGNNVENWELD